MVTFPLHRLLAAPLLALPLMLAACAPNSAGLRDNAGLESIHKASVSFQQSVHPLTIGKDGLSAEESAALDSFVNGMGLSFADRITLQSGEAARAEQYRDWLNAALGRHGLAISSVQQGTGFAPGRAQLVIDRATVSLPDCGRHTQPLPVNWQNQNMSNYGCATASNIATMVANPADLVSGNTLSLQPASAVAKPVEAWNAHELTGITGGKQGWTAQGPGTKPDSATKLSEPKVDTKQ